MSVDLGMTKANRYSAAEIAGCISYQDRSRITTEILTIKIGPIELNRARPDEATEL